MFNVCLDSHKPRDNNQKQKQFNHWL
ncbi:hypothetical protein EMIT0P2_60082 [Pseudomonas sp. IT-P2]